MFAPTMYEQRRQQLSKRMEKGIGLFLGHNEAPMNYPDNYYYFRQNSTFLYFFGLDQPGLNAIIDFESGEATLFGNDFTLDDIVWMGPQPTLAERAASVGISDTRPATAFGEYLIRIRQSGREIHHLPEYRGENREKLLFHLQINPENVATSASSALIQAIIAQREIKNADEIAAIEAAHATTYNMQTTAMRMARSGISEQQITGTLTGIATAGGGHISFPIILSQRGEILHNHDHSGVLTKNRLLLVDCGAENPLHYAADITRTIPVDGKFNQQQRDIYTIVLNAELTSIAACRPGVRFRDIHLGAARVIATGLKDLGLMRGPVDDAVAAGAHALFFPHGLGHMMGLDVHDMEDLGENLVGYSESIKRSSQFGLAALRLGKELRPGHVLTVEPGLYFIPDLLAKWKAANMHSDFLNYGEIEKWLGFGGVRLEDDVLITAAGSRILGEQTIPRQIDDVEAMVASAHAE
jgi:Xaa-Pro aminopeptidase